MKRTYVDSGVLIAAVRGGTDISNPAMSVLDDPDREFVSSVFVRLETMPLCVYNKRPVEQAFYEAFFASVVTWAERDKYSLDHEVWLNARGFQWWAAPSSG